MSFYFVLGVCRPVTVLLGKVPNQLVLKKEGLPLDYLAKYRVRNRAHQIYKAAAKLWAEGLAWERALAIVTEAFDAATYEPGG